MFNVKNIFLSGIIVIGSWVGMAHASVSPIGPDLDSGVALRCNDNEYVFQDFVTQTLAIGKGAVSAKTYTGTVAQRLKASINMRDGTVVPDFTEAVAFVISGSETAYIGLSRDGCVFLVMEVRVSEYVVVDEYLKQFDE